MVQPIRRVMMKQRLSRVKMNQVERKEEIKEKKEIHLKIVPAKKRKMS